MLFDIKMQFSEQDGKADIDSVILTGGATRIPMVRAALAAAVGEYVCPRGWMRAINNLVISGKN
jgi:molecular chaperone DnaK (HSP70)